MFWLDIPEVFRADACKYAQHFLEIFVEDGAAWYAISDCAIGYQLEHNG